VRAFALIAAATVAACTSTRAVEDDCHWIGSVNPLSGGLGPVGLALENAAKLAVQDVNTVGRVGNKTLCIATGDDRTNPDRARAIVRELIDKQDIRAINGAAGSSATLLAAEVAKEEDMAIVSCCSTSPALTADPEIYRTVPSDALQGVALANLAKSVGAKQVAVIYLDNAYGAALHDEFQRAFVGEDRAITQAVAYQERQSSYVDVINRALSGTPDYAVLIAYPVEGTQIIRDWRTSGARRDIRWLATDGLKDENFALAAGDIDLQGTAPIPNGPHYQGFVERYQAAYGGEFPGIFTSNQYDAVILIALAIARAGEGAEPSAIRTAIPEISKVGTEVDADDLERAIELASGGEDIDYVGVSGDVDLDDNGDVLAGYRVWRIAAGQSGLEETNRCFECAPGENSGAGCIEEGC
jgi:branched-chain amino acid transport system substrate-binding protein